MNKDEWTAQFLQFRVICSVPVIDYSEFTCIIKKTTKMRCLMNHFVEKLGVPVAKLRFNFDGRRLQGKDTPKDLGMEQDEEIEVYGEQPWRE